jgi:hypothetical protein
MLRHATENKGGTYKIIHNGFVGDSLMSMPYTFEPSDAVNGFFAACTNNAYITGHDLEKIEYILDDACSEWNMLGVWLDVYNQEWYFDNTFWFESRNDAIRFAKRYNQLAIWDVANKEEIYV